MQPATEQILAWPYQQEPQRAEGEVERVLRGQRLLGEAANDCPRRRSLTLGLRRHHDSLSVEDQQQQWQLPGNFNVNQRIFSSYEVWVHRRSDIQTLCD